MNNRNSSIIFMLLIIIIWVSPLYAGQARLRISSYVFDEVSIESIEAEITFGRKLAARIIGNYPLVDDDKLHQYVAKVAKAVSLYSARPELKYHVGIIDSDEINAFAAPGGYIFITRAALIAMENEAQLAAVIGHEMAHIQQRHILKELKFKGYEKSAVADLGNLIGGATSSIRVALDQTLDKAQDILFKRGYKNEDEIEADRISILMTSVAGYAPLALKKFLNKVQHFESQATTIEGEHPLHEMRMQKIDETLNNNGLLLLQQANIRERFHDTVKASGFKQD